MLIFPLRKLVLLFALQDLSSSSDAFSGGDSDTVPLCESLHILQLLSSSVFDQEREGIFRVPQKSTYHLPWFDL